MVDDGSPDGSWEKVQNLALSDPHTTGIRLSRNFGQHNALVAGMQHSRGDFVVIMDCDLQDVPEAIPDLYSKLLHENLDLVMARRIERQDTLLKRMSSMAFYKLFNALVDDYYDPSIANFGIYRRKVIASILSLREQHRFFPINIRWVGFKCGTLDVQHGRRFAGKTSYTLVKLIKYVSNNIVLNSGRPLELIFVSGACISGISALVSALMLMKYLFFGATVTGWTSIMISLYLIGGFLVMSMGVIGLYLKKTLDEAKGRPLFFIDTVVTHSDPLS